jgi:hypothetical protein
MARVDLATCHLLRCHERIDARCFYIEQFRKVRPSTLERVADQEGQVGYDATPLSSAFLLILGGILTLVLPAFAIYHLYLVANNR